MIESLPELAKFSETGTKPGEMFDVSLALSTSPIRCFTPSEEIGAAKAFQFVIGKNDTNFRIEEVQDPIRAALQRQEAGTISLVLHSATDPILNQRMFRDGPELGQLLMGHIYMPEETHESPSLHAIGISKQGLMMLNTSQIPQVNLLESMKARRNELLGRPSNEDFRRVLQSNRVSKIIAHALGPAGTNISQAMAEYIINLGVDNKTDIIVHPQGIEPMEYAELAAKQVEPGVIPIHMECAVYYEMGKLFNQRRSELVFADHHYMPLDAMRLASKKRLEELEAIAMIHIATHPSPKPLIDPWIEANRASWIKASSNAAAANMVRDDQVEACVTTASSLVDKPSLETINVFGSPFMLFTIGTALNRRQFRQYLK